MRYRLTNHHLKMLVEGKVLRCGRAVITPNKGVRDEIKKMIDTKFTERYDIFIERGIDGIWELSAEEKE